MKWPYREWEPPPPLTAWIPVSIDSQRMPVELWPGMIFSVVRIVGAVEVKALRATLASGGDVRVVYASRNIERDEWVFPAAIDPGCMYDFEAEVEADWALVPRTP